MSDNITPGIENTGESTPENGANVASNESAGGKSGNTDVSRRDFLKKSAMAVLGVIGLGIADKFGSNSPETEEQNPEINNNEAGGVSGSAEEGFKNPAVLEVSEEQHLKSLLEILEDGGELTSEQIEILEKFCRIQRKKTNAGNGFNIDDQTEETLTEDQLDFLKKFLTPSKSNDIVRTGMGGSATGGGDGGPEEDPYWLDELLDGRRNFTPEQIDALEKFCRIEKAKITARNGYRIETREELTERDKDILRRLSHPKQNDRVDGPTINQ